MIESGEFEVHIANLISKNKWLAIQESIEHSYFRENLFIQCFSPAFFCDSIHRACKHIPNEGGLVVVIDSSKLFQENSFIIS